jgi:hypothetical protein
MTYTVTSFGKAFAHVRNCLLKKAHVINKNIDGFYAKTTQEDSGSYDHIHEYMNIMLVNIEFFTGRKKIKQRHISFVPG